MHRSHITWWRGTLRSHAVLALSLALLAGCLTTPQTLQTQHPLEEISGALLDAAAVPLDTVFPVSLDSTWVYHGIAASAPLTASYVVTETLVGILRSAESAYVILQMERDLALDWCPFEADAAWCEGLQQPEPTTFWYLLDRQTLYRQDKLAVHKLPDHATVELRFPLKVDDQWYLTSAMEALHPEFDLDSMLRKVVRSTALRLPAGDFQDCYLLTDIVGGTETQIWFCSAVGFVLRASEHHGTPYGHHEWLVAYELN